MIGHKLPNKTKNATVAEPKLFHQLNNPLGYLKHTLKLLEYEYRVKTAAFGTLKRYSILSLTLYIE
jgi:hypothetical protein